MSACLLASFIEQDGITTIIIIGLVYLSVAI